MEPRKNTEEQLQIDPTALPPDSSWQPESQPRFRKRFVVSAANTALVNQEGAARGPEWAVPWLQGATRTRVKHDLLREDAVPTRTVRKRPRRGWLVEFLFAAGITALILYGYALAIFS